MFFNQSFVKIFLIEANIFSGNSCPEQNWFRCYNPETEISLLIKFKGYTYLWNSVFIHNLWKDIVIPLKLCMCSHTNCTLNLHCICNDWTCLERMGEREREKHANTCTIDSIRISKWFFLNYQELPSVTYKIERKDV